MTVIALHGKARRVWQAWAFVISKIGDRSLEELDRYQKGKEANMCLPRCLHNQTVNPIADRTWREKVKRTYLLKRLARQKAVKTDIILAS